MRVSAYIPCFNNEKTIGMAIQSILNQCYKVDELIVIDDGSTDNSQEIIKCYDVRLIKLKENKGRGFVRNLAICECKNELILCCDATNSLDRKFLSNALKHFNNNSDICSVSGVIKAKKQIGAVCRWRSRHLFKEEVKYADGQITNTALVTYGTLVRRSMILEAGNFDPIYKHSEDEELGERLLHKGYKSIGDPALITFSEITNSMYEVLERHWRWHVGKNEKLNLYTFINIFRCSLNPMLVQDLRASDIGASIISLIYPFFFLFKTLFAKENW